MIFILTFGVIMNKPLDTNTPTDSTSFLSGLKDEPTNVAEELNKPKEENSFSDKIEASLAKGKSVIGKNIKFRGELIGTEDLHIEGKIEGTVLMEGQNLSIGKEGEIEANVHAQTIIINGKLTGDVLADDIIEIRSSAVVKGNLIAPRIKLDDGGKFRGSMDMIDTEQESRNLHSKFKEKLIHPHLPNASAAEVKTAPKHEVTIIKQDEESKKK
jgi:cytoskeletal protein CcmA (bactofilin family)